MNKSKKVRKRKWKGEKGTRDREEAEKERGGGREWKKQTDAIVKKSEEERGGMERQSRWKGKGDDMDGEGD